MVKRYIKKIYEENKIERAGTLPMFEIVAIVEDGSEHEVMLLMAENEWLEAKERGYYLC